MTEHPLSVTEQPSGSGPLAVPARWLRTALRAPAGKKDRSTSHEGGYTAEAAQFDKVLDEKIASIRAGQESGEIGVRHALDLRVEALSHHLAALEALRDRYFGDHG